LYSGRSPRNEGRHPEHNPESLRYRAVRGRGAGGSSFAAEMPSQYQGVWSHFKCLLPVYVRPICVTKPVENQNADRSEMRDLVDIAIQALCTRENRARFSQSLLTLVHTTSPQIISCVQSPSHKLGLIAVWSRPSTRRGSSSISGSGSTTTSERSYRHRIQRPAKVCCHDYSAGRPDSGK